MNENTYNPKNIESKIYNICKDRGYFEVDSQKHKNGKNFSIMMPPPNVTGVLHIGHALTFTLQDIITRFKRMQGFSTLYQPGLDHAGIATQNVVEKQLLAQGIKKEELGREKFLEKVWEWKNTSGGKIAIQMEALGITPAWSRMRFTMDSGLKSAVRKAFVEWFNKGLITQGDYMVNWCTHDGALSDIEVEYEEQDTNLYYLKYNILDSKDSLIVATTRPETFFGDTAVMVNPLDSRYSNLIGKYALLPLLDKKIPIIGDEAVDMEFGSGVVKVTPAHDINDYEVGKRHNLESIKIFDEKGILNEFCGEFKGLERLEARESIVKKLESINAVEKIEAYKNKVGKCYRCGNIIEPYISKQWFISPTIAESTIKRVNNGESKFFPSQWINNFNAWMKELRPWCISRQLWWGHRIPVWECECGHIFASTNEVESNCPKCKSGNIKQDKDVLDTWFSSGLWAFSTLGWGNEEFENDKFNKEDLSRFYPNSLLITGFDILFFWVARMLFSGENLMGELPFKDIYLHALVRDDQGRKMSKSLGNIIDPLEMIETYGADSLRFTLAYLCVQGRDIRLSTDQLKISQNFANKLFNATNFLLMYAAQQGFNKFEDKENLSDFKTPLGIYAKSRLNAATKELLNALENYRFNDGASILYRFLWGEFCDYFIEFAKAQKEAVSELGSVLKDALKLLHPYMPFITEDLYHKLNGTNLENADSIMIELYPHDTNRNKELESKFEIIKDSIISLRRAKALLDLANKPIAKAFIKANLDECDLDFVKKLARVEAIEIVESKINNCVADVGEFSESYLPLSEVDLAPILTRLNSQKTKLEKEISKLESMLNNENFVKNAPQSVLDTNKENLDLAKTKYEKVKKELDSLQA